MLEHQESQSLLTPSQEVLKARLEEIRDWGQQWIRLQQVPEFKKLILGAYLGDLPDQEQRVLSLLEIYGEDHTDFKEAKAEWQTKRALKKHFKFLDEQGAKAAELLSKLEPNQGTQDNEDFNELR
jgi:hypothetical protein